MSLQQLTPETRILFLQSFVESLIRARADELRAAQAIEAEKIRMKFLHQPAIKKIPFLEFHPPRVQLPSHPVPALMPKSLPLPQKNIPLLTTPASPSPQSPSQPRSASVSASGDPLAKIHPLLQDIGVQLIECPGAGKFILVKVRNKINATKIMLSEHEIKAIINHFSEQAKIPVVGGILKAAVNDLLISAVASKFVGSRFIITKKSPYSLLENS